MSRSDQKLETYSEAETKVRSEAALKRMLATPHMPHKQAPAQEKSNARDPIKPRTRAS